MGGAASDGAVYGERADRGAPHNTQGAGLAESSVVLANRSHAADVLPRRPVAQGGPALDHSDGWIAGEEDSLAHHGDGDLGSRILERRREDDLVRPADAARRGFLVGRLPRRYGRTHVVSPAAGRVV